MILITAALVLFSLVYLTLYSTRLLKELEHEMGVVEPHKARGFIVGFKWRDDPYNIIHVMGFNDLTVATEYYLNDCNVVFITPVVNADQATWFIRGYFKQARQHGFNTLYLTPHLRLSIALINNEELRKEVQACL